MLCTVTYLVLDLFAFKKESNHFGRAFDHEVVGCWLSRHGTVKSWRKNSKTRVIWTHIESLFAKFVFLKTQYTLRC